MLRACPISWILVSVLALSASLIVVGILAVRAVVLPILLPVGALVVAVRLSPLAVPGLRILLSVHRLGRIVSIILAVILSERLPAHCDDRHC